MPKINLSVEHKLSQDEAKGRVAGLIAQSRAQFAGHVSEVIEAWDGYTDIFSFKAMGMTVSGKLQVLPSQAQIELHLPFAALPWKARIERELLSHARQLLA